MYEEKTFIKPPPPSKVDFHQRYIRIPWFSGDLLGLMWSGYGKIFSFGAIEFPKDLDLTRVKNRSFGRPNFPIKGRHIYTYFFVWKSTSGCRAWWSPFFKNSLFWKGKSRRKLHDSKNRRFLIEAFVPIIKIQRKLKNVRHHHLHLDALFQTENIYVHICRPWMEKFGMHIWKV